MSSTNIYNRAKQFGGHLEATCVSISQWKWDELMKGATRADRKEVIRAAMQAGVIDEEEGRKELRKPWYNPYKHFKTDIHLIYVYSGIEHFIRIN